MNVLLNIYVKMKISPQTQPKVILIIIKEYKIFVIFKKPKSKKYYLFTSL